MAIAQSRITAQGQISVPAEVRRKLGVGPGSVLEWNELDGRIVVTKPGKYSFEDMHERLFGDKVSQPHTLEELTQAIPTYIRKKHARG